VAGRYLLLHPLGRGGMGTVWRARDELLQREVAVKQVDLIAAVPDVERGVLRTRVLREAQAAARMSHPGSVTVFDVIEEQPNVYIVMELVGARTLAEIVEAEGPLPPPRAAQIGLELLAPLEEAHRAGIVHRDVKPSNIMVLPSGAVKLTDFGIASVKDHPSITATGQVLGSPAYMAPERAKGQPSAPATDLWGLGATLYYAVEGRPPFEREGAVATLAAVVNEQPRPPERAGPLAPVLRSLLAKTPSERPSAASLRRQLEPVAIGRDGNAGEPPASTAVEPDAPELLPPEEREHPAAPVSPPPALSGVPATGRPPWGRALVAAALVTALLIGWLTVRGGSDRAPSREEAEDAVPTTPAPRESPTAGSDPRREPRPPARPSTAAKGVPDAWVTYTDTATGYRLAYPPGWQVQRLDRTRTDFRDPSTGAYLRVDWTDTPGDSPEAAWRAQSASFGSRHAGYREIRIEPTVYKGFEAAIWEYTYMANGPLHAVDLGFVTPTHGFALNFQTPEGIWTESQDTFEAFKAAFEPPAR
jgi:serine/threonine protein kinase